MKKIFYFFAATVVLAAVGCSKDDAASNDAKFVSEIKIGFEGDTRVTAAHSAAGLKFAWEDGDAVYVYEDGNINATAKMLEYDAASATFKPQDGNNTNKLQVGKKYFAVTYSDWYFISKDENTGASVVESKLGSGTGVENIPMISDVFEATAENSMTTMHHLVGVVEIPVKAAVAGVQLQQMYLYSQRSNNAISGFFAVSPIAPYNLIYGDRTGYFENANQTDSDAPIELSTTEAKSIFIPAFPGIYEPIDFKYALVGKSVAVIETTRPLIVERGKITKVSEFTLE